MAWFRLASHLHLPLQEVMQKTTSQEFVDWMTFLDQEVNSFHREDYYLAQIAAEVRRTFTKNPSHIKTKDFIIEFKTNTSKKKTSKKSPEEKLKMSKTYWLSLSGVKNV